MRPLNRLLRDEDGGPALEFTVIAAFIALSLPAMIDIATIINVNMKLSAGMRVGTQYALQYPSDEDGIAQAIASGSNLSADDITVNTEPFCECDGLEASCTSTCSYGVKLSRYVNITAEYDISNQYNYTNMPYPQTVAKTIAIRIQ